MATLFLIHMRLTSFSYSKRNFVLHVHLLSTLFSIFIYCPLCSPFSFIFHSFLHFHLLSTLFSISHLFSTLFFIFIYCFSIFHVETLFHIFTEGQLFPSFSYNGSSVLQFHKMATLFSFII